MFSAFPHVKLVYDSPGKICKVHECCQDNEVYRVIRLL